MSQAAGFVGIPVFGHVASAEVKASCSASSARSNDPARRINVARMRPDSWRNTVSAAVFASKLIRFRKIVHGTNLDASFGSSASSRDLLGPFDSFVQVLAVEDVVAGELLFGFREWAI